MWLWRFRSVADEGCAATVMSGSQIVISTVSFWLSSFWRLLFVREDEARRRPKAPPKGGQFAATLGEQARRLSNLPNEVDVKGAEVPCAFGTAAFIESLLLLGYRHMNGSGQPIKCCAPAAAKAMYLINFLHHQHDRLAKEVVWRREQEKAAAAEQAATVLVRPRSPPPAPTPKALVIPRVSAMNKMVGAARKVLRAQREARSNQHRNAVVTAVDIPDTDAGTSPSGNSSPSQSSSRCALEPGGPPGAGPEPPLSSRGNVPPKEEKPVHWPDSAAYTTVAEAFLKNNQDLIGT
ncbi:unnamed protein product [Effrenium voratum]|nr:unnamed protein product [Effrenium voratum]